MSDFVNLLLAVLGTIIVIFMMLGIWVILKLIVPLLLFTASIWFLMEFLK